MLKLNFVLYSEHYKTSYLPFSPQLCLSYFTFYTFFFFLKKIKMLPSAVEQSMTLDDPLARDMGDASSSHEQVSGHGNLPGYLSLNHASAEVKEPVSGATKLRKMLFETNELVVCPGVYDGLSARTAIELGFNAMYMVRRHGFTVTNQRIYTNASWNL